MNFEQTSMWNRLQNKPGNYYTEAAEPEREEFRRWVKGLLWDGPVLIEFIKTDGSVRVMNCTLNNQHGAVYPDNVTETTDFAQTPVPLKKVNTDVCPVWDIDQKGWRSFRWDRLKKIEFKIG